MIVVLFCETAKSLNEGAIFLPVPPQPGAEDLTFRGHAIIGNPTDYCLAYTRHSVMSLMCISSLAFYNSIIPIR